VDTIAARLKLTLERKGKSVRAFQQALENREGEKILGASYANIRRYVSDGTDSLEPSPIFLKAAAKELGVRVEWLAFNSGPVEDPEPAAARDVFDKKMGEVFPPYLLSRPTVQEGLASVWWEVVRRRADLAAGRQASPSQVTKVAKGKVGREIANRIGLAIKAPLFAVDGDALDLDDPVARDAYLLALTQALTIASQTFVKRVGRMLESAPASVSKPQT